MQQLKPQKKLRYLKLYIDARIDVYPEDFPTFDRWLSLELHGQSLLAKERIQEAKKAGCCYCGVAFGAKIHVQITKDHVIPSSKGGKGTSENIMYACFSCNNWKDAKTLKQWLRELQSIVKTRKAKKRLTRHYDLNRVGIMIGRIKVILDSINNRSNTEKQKASIYKT